MQVEDLSCPVCEFSLRTFTKPKRERSGRRRNPANDGENTVLALAIESEENSSFYTTMTDLIVGSIDESLSNDISSVGEILDEIAKHRYFDSMSKKFVTPVIEMDLLAFILEKDPVVSALFYLDGEKIHRKEGSV